MPDKKEIDDFLMSAWRGENAAVIEFLDKYPDAVDRTNDERATALMHAASRGRKETVELLLARGAAIDAKDNWGRTSLMIAAAECQSADVVVLLLEKGANVQEINNHGWTALGYARGSPEIVGIIEQHIAEREFAAERNEIAKIVMGGLQKPIRAPRPVGKGHHGR